MVERSVDLSQRGTTWRKGMKGIRRLAFATVILLASFAASAETVGTLALDGLSFISFQDHQVLLLSGSTIRFHFGTPQPDGSVPFTIAPDDVSIPDIPLPTGETLHYALASAASGLLHPNAAGHTVQFSASVTVTLSNGVETGSNTYGIPFTTETVAVSSGGQTLSVTGVRIVPAARYVQLVGATVNKPDAVPQPGTAVYTVLSGSFDQLPTP
jgi:hypothetical protein